jgi:hypothetical protein
MSKLTDARANLSAPFEYSVHDLKALAFGLAVIVYLVWLWQKE